MVMSAPLVSGNQRCCESLCVAEFVSLRSIYWLGCRTVNGLQKLAPALSTSGQRWNMRVLLESFVVVADD
jgi:hypothetical protein